MNVHDSERMAGLLEQAGYEPTGDPADADVVVINTCSVRERAEEKLFSRLGELKMAGEGRATRQVVAVAGCVAQQEKERVFARSRLVDVVVGTQSLRELPRLIEQARGSGASAIDVNPYDDVSFPLGVARRRDPVKAYVTIIEGCNDYCAFCIVPYTRGHERMRPATEILADVREAAETGHREVQLLGQIVNHYQSPDDPGCDFAELLARVSAVPGIARVRFASPHPRHVSRRLIEAIRDLPNVCKHVHLPVQSGSTEVLSRMRRRYTREQYLALVDELRAEVPNLQLSTDVIVGFPGERPQDFDDTLSLAEQVRFNSMFSFKYSPRPNTLAFKRMPDDVSEEEKTRRIVTLQQLQRGIQFDLHRAQVGRTVEILVDSVSRRDAGTLAGRTSGNTVVNVAGPSGLLGQVVRATITEAGPNSLRGSLAPAPGGSDAG
jgi:tRNA-2-methylthio-N6-dimethylallyladenosine synthase